MHAQLLLLAALATSAYAATVCEDVPVPGDQHGCVNQAAWGNCGQSWMSGYCLKSCGACPKAGCEDKPVPGDTFGCEKQAQWGNCGAGWMTGYCQNSCGKCPVVGCSDTPVPGDAHGCVSQAQWGNCGADWMKGYCQQSCGTCPGAQSPASLQVYKKCKNPNTVAFAWDDGWTQYQESIIDQFDAAGFKTTFFTTGKLYNCIYNEASVQSLRKAYASGHQIASHTWSHPNMANLAADLQREELVKLETALSKIIGAKPTYFRPPYISSGTGLRSVLLDLGYRGEVQMNIDTQDYAGYSVNQSYAAVVAGIEGADKGGIVLAHEFYNSSANELLPRVISYAKATGIKLVTVAECVGDEPANMYKEAGEQGVRDETWVC